jgi:hypothetical protein
VTNIKLIIAIINIILPPFSTTIEFVCCNDKFSVIFAYRMYDMVEKTTEHHTKSIMVVLITPFFTSPTIEKGEKPTN